MRTTDELVWDLAVDFVCVGAGAGGLAAAVVAVDAGASAFVANFGRPLDRTSQDLTGQLDPSTGGLDRTLGVEVADAETAGYLAALIEDLDQYSAPSSNDGVPVLAVEDFTPVDSKKPGKRDQVPPFHGGRLGDWAAQCIASPFGVVYSRVITDAAAPKRSRSGAMVEVARIGSLELNPDVPAPPLMPWLSAAARKRGIDVPDRSWLQRLVFEDGQVIGAVFDTPTATLAVRARHGVMLASDAVPTDGATSLAAQVRQPTIAELCLVREPLSRFSRIELHVSEASLQTRVGAPSR